MTGRLVLTLAALACGRAAFAQPLRGDIPPPPPRPTVTLGSSALTDGHSTYRAVGFTADSRSVYVFSHQDWRLWDIATGKDAEGKAGGINSGDQLYPAPDGRTVLCLGRDQERAGKLRIVDLKTGFELASKSFSPGDTVVPSDDVACLGIDRGSAARIVWLDGKTAEVTLPVAGLRRLAKASAANVLALLGDDRVAVNSPAGLWKLDLPKDTAYTSVGLTADGSVLATASAVETDNGKRPGPIDLWDVAARKKLRTVEAVEWFAEAPHRLRFTPDGKTLVAGDGAYLRGWSAATGAKTFAVEPGWGWVGNVQISPDGRYVAVAYANRPMVYELTTGRQPAALLGHSAPVWEVAFSPDGKRVATAMFGRPTVYVWDAATGKNVGEFQAAFTRPRDGGRTVPGRVRVQFSFDGTKLLTTNEASGATPPIRLWDAATLGLLKEIPVPDGDDVTAAFTRRGVFTIRDRKPTLLDPATAAVVWEKPPVPRAVRFAVSPTGDRVAVEGRKDTAVWAAADGQELDRAAGEPVAFTQDGLGLLSNGKKHAARFRDLAANRDATPVQNDTEGQPFAAAANGLVAMRFYSDGRTEYRIVEARTALQVSTCEMKWPSETFFVGRPNEGDPILVFSPDGRSFARVGSEVVVFETYSGQELIRREGGWGARAAAFPPDGRMLFTAHGNEDYGSQVLGWDTADGTGPAPKPDDLARLKALFNDKPAAARRALYVLATRPPEAVDFAREVTKLATAADYADYATWLIDLDAPAFAVREAATKELAKAGWRAEAMMQQALAKTESAEVRERLEKLLAKRDMRPLRAVHLLEVVGTPAAVAALKEVAAGPTESLVVQDAKCSLLRIEQRTKP